MYRTYILAYMYLRYVSPTDWRLAHRPLCFILLVISSSVNPPHNQHGHGQGYGHARLTAAPQRRITASKGRGKKKPELRPQPNRRKATRQLRSHIAVIVRLLPVSQLSAKAVTRGHWKPHPSPGGLVHSRGAPALLLSAPMACLRAKSG
jgi:hypothetical protein